MTLAGKIFKRSALASSLILGSLTTCFAADPAAQEDVTANRRMVQSGWEFQATAYLWATALNGSVRVRNLPSADVNVDFSDILENLDGAFMGSFLAKHGNWMVLGDLVYADLSDSTRLSVARSPTLKYSQTLLIASAIGGYRLPIANQDIDLSVTAGLRYQRLTAKTSLTSGTFPVSVQSDTTRDWTDPIVGLSLQYEFNDRWFVNGIADVGGFGVGSQFTSQGFLAAGYNWSSHISTAIGYRALYTDYQSGSGSNTFDYETTIHGPFMSLGVRF